MGATASSPSIKRYAVSVCRLANRCQYQAWDNHELRRDRPELQATKGCTRGWSVLGQNPLPLFYPCHRVIGSEHNLVGFTGGMPIKEKLLQNEGAILI